MDVGAELRKARERRGMSLAVLASTTKIGVATLQAMERGDFARLPGGLFTRGFLRAYAREVGLDPEETVQQYLAEFDIAPPAERTNDAEAVTTPELTVAEMEELERRAQRNQLVGGALVLLIGPFLYFTFLGRHPGASSNAAAQPSPPPAVTSVTGEVGTAGASEPSRPADSNPWSGTLHLEIRPTGACWVSAVADGRQGLQRLMAAGEHETIDATDEVTLRLGDPPACVFSINGAVAQQAGKPGQPVTLHITGQNFRDFLSPALAAAPGVPPARPVTPPALNGPTAARIPSEPMTVRPSPPTPPASLPDSEESLLPDR